jgi:hypothetical protein
MRQLLRPALFTEIVGAVVAEEGLGIWFVAIIANLVALYGGKGVHTTI